jgi:hypothetical protein
VNHIKILSSAVDDLEVFFHDYVLFGDVSTATFCTRLGKAISAVPQLHHLKITNGEAVIGSILQGLNGLTSLRSMELTCFCESEAVSEFPGIADGFLNAKGLQKLHVFNPLRLLLSLRSGSSSNVVTLGVADYAP